ncbi:hypothetical protein FPV67DRAFT_1668818 [Lyophyllum atratum]|nr:hypothetical protein FPV67DRAFT_1668818 [Lyophyllum atratum]
MSHFILNVAITGDPASGKRSLKQKIDTCAVRRNGKTFGFLGHIVDDASGRLDVDFAVAVIDASQSYYSFMKKPYVRQACDLVTAARTCVVGTKRDMIPHDYSSADLNARCQPTWAAYYQRVRYFSVDCLGGQGVNSLCEHIVNVTSRDAKRSITSQLTSAFSKFTTYMLDLVAATFSLPVPRDVNRDTPDGEELDDDTVDSLVSSPLAKAWDEALKARANSTHDHMPTHQISTSLIAKANSPHERAAMDYVRRHTLIPVPQLRHRNLREWLVSDLIEGEMLLECWDKQSPFMKFRIACTMRRYLSQLRSLQNTMPGRPEDHVVDGRLFEHQAHGPFQSLYHFQSWCEMIAMTGWCSVAAHFRNVGRLAKLKSQPVVGEPWDLVYAHGDLNLSNIILSKNGVLWIIDWQESGFFPSWFDGVSMASYEEAPQSWHFLRPFMAGKESDNKYDNLWSFFLQDIHRFAYSEPYEG